MKFNQNTLYDISNKKYLSELLQVDKNKLKFVSKHFISQPFTKEKNGKTREFYKPTNEHKKALKRLVKFLNKLDIPDYMTDGVPKRSYVSNVNIHKLNKFGIIIDISNFFPSTDGNRVYKFFKNDLNQSDDIAKILENLTTVTKMEKSFLPQGYPTSPILSFLVYRGMYEQLATFAKKHKLCFSAYYDDLTFSSDKFIPKRLKKNIITIIESYSLNINKSKSKVTRLDYTKITGCVILNGELKAPRKLQKETYELYKILENDPLAHYSKSEVEQFLRKFRGKISSIQMIEKNRNFPNYMTCISKIKNDLK